MKRLIWLCMLSILFTARWGAAQPWSFIFMSDLHGSTNTWLLSAKFTTVNPGTTYAPAELFVSAGDLTGGKFMEPYNQAFPEHKLKGQVLARGNHDENETSFVSLVQSSTIGQVKTPGANSVADYRNVRFIVVDPYASQGIWSNRGCLLAPARTWVETSITSAPSTIKHIFIMFHEPAFPRYRHVGDSFDACPTDRNLFWNMLVKHKVRVRALLVGHTHGYSRLQVLDPTSACANDSACRPADKGGVFQLNGTSFNLLQIQITDSVTHCRLLDKSGKTLDEWTMGTDGQTMTDPERLGSVKQRAQMAVVHPMANGAHSGVISLTGRRQRASPGAHRALSISVPTTGSAIMDTLR